MLSIIQHYNDVLDGEPWFGRSVYELLNEIEPAKAFIKPNKESHSLAELLYHMITWAEFTLARIEKDKIKDLAAFEELDWRNINPKKHGWEEGIAAFIATHQQILALLETKNDAWLEEKVDYRKYNYRYLLNGMMEHNIYHIGQIAYLHKLL